MITLEDITEDFIIANRYKYVWMRWDYLCMRTYEEEGENRKILDKVAIIKKNLVDAGKIPESDNLPTGE